MPISAQKLANVRAFHREIRSPRHDGAAANLPLLVAIETTTRCNFHCVHCARAYADRDPVDLDLDLFETLLAPMRTAIELYLFGDGEVLLDTPRHLAMIARVHKENPECELGFSTNGSLLTPEVYRLYAAAGVAYIQVSVDAATPELYGIMRRGGDFESLTRNLEAIAAIRRGARSRQPRLYLATVISRQNAHELPLLAEFAARYGFVYWFINAEYPSVPGRERLLLTGEDRRQLELFRANLARDHGPDFKALFDPSISLSPTAADSWLQAASPVYCTVPWQRLELKANGDVKFCPYFHEPVFSMNGRSFDEVWNGAEFRALRQAFASGGDVPKYCAACKLGLRKQYLPGYPGLPADHGHWLRRLIPAVISSRWR
ncbi:MAG: radical SAM protein [Acidobacteria bacterium]|nr:radical SAM protein [Acidobacteriota bacterium]